MSPLTAPPTGESIIPIDLKIRQLTRLPLPLAVLACLALFGLLFRFRSPLQASVYGSRKVLNSKATYIPIIPNDSAMQSVKIVEAVTKQTGTVIFLHGLGDAGTSFVPFAKVLQQQHPHLRFVFPTAQTLPITLNSGYPMPAWFDIKDLSRLTNSIHDDEAGMMRSVAAVESLIEKEVKERGIKEDRIVIGGFSQGCVISILTALRTQRSIAGVVSLSGWLPLSHKIEELASPGAKNLAVFWGHGKDDGVVNYKYGQQSCELLQSLKTVNLPLLPKGTPYAKPGLRFESYEGLTHSLGDKEIKDLSEWLKYAVPA